MIFGWQQYSGNLLSVDAMVVMAATVKAGGFTGSFSAVEVGSTVTTSAFTGRIEGPAGIQFSIPGYCAA